MSTTTIETTPTTDRTPAPAAASTTRPAPVTEATPTPTPHASGAIPAVPALVAGSNATVAVVSAAVVAGGPFAVGLAATAGVAATTAAAVGVVRGRRERRAAGTAGPSRAERRAAKAAAARQAGGPRHGKVGALAPRGLGGTPGARKSAAGGPGGRAGGKSGAKGGGSGLGAKLAGALGGGKGAGKSGGPAKGRTAGKGKSATGGKAAGKAAGRSGGASTTGGKGGSTNGPGPGAARIARMAKGAVGAARGAVRGAKASRAAARSADASRADRRKQRVADRADHRAKKSVARSAAKAAKQAAKQAVKAKTGDDAGKATAGDPKDTAKLAKKVGGRGRLGRLWAAIRLGKLRDWVGEHWQAAFEARVARVRAGMASRHARRMLRASAIRFWLRSLLMISATMPLAVVGFAVGALTRLSGSTAPIHTGRRLRKHLIDRAREARLARDDAVADQLDLYENQDDDDTYPPVADTVVEAPRRGGAAPTTTAQGARTMSDTGGFPLNEMCEAIQSAAAAWEPTGAMQAVALAEAMPEALATFAGAFAVLANKADEQMPFHKAIADALDGLHQLLLQSASGAEDVPALVHTLHADDIARHREPRPGEEMWDISNNSE